MEVLASRFVLHPNNFEVSRQFYEHTLGLKIYHEYGNGTEVIGVIYFAGGGFIELSEGSGSSEGDLWLQVADLEAEQAHLDSLGYEITERAQQMSWGLMEMVIHDPDGVRITLVEVPREHFLRLGRF